MKKSLSTVKTIHYFDDCKISILTDGYGHYMYTVLDSVAGRCVVYTESELTYTSAHAAETAARWGVIYRSL